MSDERKQRPEPEWNAETKAANVRWLCDVGRVFTLAGLTITAVHEEPNRYCGDTCCPGNSCAVVTTKEIGVIEFYWRKRVCVVDWSRSNVNVDGEALYAGDWRTHDHAYLHCWKYDEAIAALKALVVARDAAYA